ncbi:MAG: diguanylate cyclase [Myxococcota bacterium]
MGEGWHPVARGASHIDSPTQHLRVSPDDPTDVPRSRRATDLTRPSILLVEDDRTSRLTLARHLEKQDYEVTAVGTGEEGLEALMAGAHRIVLLDLGLPGMNGTEVCRRIRLAEQDIYTYIVILTGSEGEDSLIEAFESGADDYMTKPFKKQELSARLRVGERLLRFHARMKESERRIKELARLDGLTGVFNRAALDERVAAKLRDAKVGGGPVGYLMVDIDFFKRINDTFGHQAGDEVLREVARRLKASVRTEDDVGRYGGEEFGVVLFGANAQAIRAVSTRVWGALREAPIEWEGHSISITASIGAHFSDAGGPVSALYANADAALYRAKRTGRDRVVFLDEAEEFVELVVRDPGESGSNPPAVAVGS